MCNIFSGHIVTDKDSPDWGKVLFVTGVHHEKDREHPSVSKYAGKIAAWESVDTGSFASGVKFTHDCGQDISAVDKQALLDLVNEWGKAQERVDLISSFDSGYAYLFCLDCEPTAEERKIMVERITDSKYAYLFCRYCTPTAEERKILVERVTDSWYAYLFCCFCNPTAEERKILEKRYN